ncbi:helix-turn-helix domain-containing protein [Microbacterium hominis]|uniref:helix-turn-helix domain-containing protein n=1 Tax=Microbacterium hominis TaxID=162426 RepID=UPI001963C4E1|nr:cupin domain-containing protein [Microbacterium hominis]QRY40499.1 helix-turn-helix domain-containing protein [Microbacterium hominis]
MSDAASSRRRAADAPLADDGPASAARALGARIRALRQRRGMTLTQVAVQAELSHSFLSQVERGLERMSMTSLFRVAQALGTTQQALLTDDADAAVRTQGEFHVFRASEATPLDAGGSPLRVLARDHPRFVPMVMSGTFSEDLWWVHDEEEFVYVLEGRLVVVLEDQEFALEVGDAVYYHGGIRHRWRTEPGESTRVLTVKEGSAGAH